MITELGLAIAGTYAYNYLNNSDERKIKHKLKEFIGEKELQNTKGVKAAIDNIELLGHGFRATLDISEICDFEEVQKHQDYLKQVFRASSVTMENTKGKTIISVVSDPVTGLEHKRVLLPPTTLLLGYKDTGALLVADMLKMPHIGIVGLSLSGKSKMVEVVLNNLVGANVVLLNVFKKDFRSVQARRINRDKEILEFLNKLLEMRYERTKPLYVVIDELNILSDNKDINKAIGNLLKVARHYNIYLICMAQDMVKETVKFKNLFNIRVCFRCVEESSYRAFLGGQVREGNLLPREFYCLSDGLYKGYTYTI